MAAHQHKIFSAMLSLKISYGQILSLALDSFNIKMTVKSNAFDFFFKSYLTKAKLKYQF